MLQFGILIFTVIAHTNGYPINISGSGSSESDSSESNSSESNSYGEDESNDDTNDIDSTISSGIALLAGMSPLILAGSVFISIILYNLTRAIISDIKEKYIKCCYYKNKAKFPIKNDMLTLKYIKKLNKNNMKKKEDDEDISCPICLDSIDIKTYNKNDNNIINTSCKHIYHTECLQEWVKQNIQQGNAPECPMCRENICKEQKNKDIISYNSYYNPTLHSSYYSDDSFDDY